MFEESKAIAVITNHFKEQPVNPKIVFANSHLLNMVGYGLDEVASCDPSKIFANWNNHEFIQEIVACVENKVSWVGTLIVLGKDGKQKKQKFTITPVYGLDGDINFYSCSTPVKSKKCAKNVDGSFSCLDDFVTSMTQYYEHFQQVCVMAPENLLKIDIDGKITYINPHAQEQFNLSTGDNVFDIVSSSKNKIIDFFKSNGVVGKVSKIDFDMNSCSVKCKFWPISSDNKTISGYSLSLTDITKRREVARQLLAMKGA